MPITDSFTPPTSSLYQFSALSGIVIILFSLYWLIDADKDLGNKSVDLAKVNNQVTAKLALFKERNNVVEEYVKTEQNLIDSEKAIAETTQKETVTARSDKTKQELKDRTANQQMQLSHLYTTNMELGANLSIGDAAMQQNLSTLQLYADIASRSLQYYYNARLVAIVLIPIGLMLSIYGFYNWYFRIQIFQDRALRNSSLPK